MALAHRRRPHYGVQFHPESVCTAFGFQLLHNFKQLAMKHRMASGSATSDRGRFSYMAS
ncbi:aminodeoxychorismate chloroplastic isoform X1 [Haematococcus lacustris]|uniref:Aminodeoxychorismate chloroplastic isoform X1 n=1 Tax=Haematococcus lacustris TaxID=44745 RepID=A0A699ZLU3_HAELA|nr:aminodeoxychorismate chloroplastic isoform X1 [Haematococcus lacustris]